MSDSIAYKILTGEQLQQLLAEGVFTGAPIDKADGYIHMSTAAQAQETLEKHFSGQTGLALAAVDLDLLGDAVKWEVSRGGALFPHIYADLPLSAVVAHAPVTYAEDGRLLFPA
ncbi:uncharacterized protein (DUF952 family) [Novosphingobium sp. PhB165]|uniref:DUF952 domain-containing protein n=1 Tax=Novosphingobium sp. PhB165 TaxID=2485105 RepID=UPI00104D3CF6|nr:DUF952 domain-containing protein [Novosphingobium sp. PhB165]TCM22147.1 uncharacterized protein (DUF952 family) [Novosphingobium sp. PhB165]